MRGRIGDARFGADEHRREVACEGPDSASCSESRSHGIDDRRGSGGVARALDELLEVRAVDHGRRAWQSGNAIVNPATGIGRSSAAAAGGRERPIGRATVGYGARGRAAHTLPFHGTTRRST